MKYFAHIDFEVWNRRKYPIVIHFVEIKFGNVMLEHRSDETTWYIFHNKLIHREHVRLDPASHRLFQPRVPFKQRNDLDETVKIDVYYFDPIANRRKRVTIEHRYKLRDEG